MQAKFRLNSKQLFLTYPKCTVPMREVIDQLKIILTGTNIVRYCVAEEEHKDGDRHIHAYIQTSNLLNIKDCKKFDLKLMTNEGEKRFHGNYQSCRSAKNVVSYIQKDGNYIQEGLDDVINGKIDKETKKEELMKLIKKEITPAEFLLKYPTLQTLQSYSRLKGNLAALCLDLQPSGLRQQVCGKWIVGPPGVGKSHFAREVIKPGTEKYVKLANRWWDGYSGQEVVILEDLSKPGLKSCLGAEELAYFLKLWTDKWDSNGEIKGGLVCLKYRLFVVTSNYSISEIFESLNDYDLLTALKRRFVEIPIIKRDSIGVIRKPLLYEDSKTQLEIDAYCKSLKSDPLTPDPLPTHLFGGAGPTGAFLPLSDTE